MTKPAVLDVRASEATRNLEKMVGAVEAYAAKGGENGCPAAPGQRSGAIGPTPPLSVDCTVGPGARCIPGAGLDADGAYYPAELWRNDDIWREMEFEIEMGHYFHYSYQYDNTITGDCTFTAAAMADLDADGTFSDYSISCTASSEGTSCDEMKVERRFE